MLTRIGGDGVDVGGPDDAHPGPTVVFHTHTDTYGNSSDDPHNEYNSKHYASNCRAPKKGRQKYIEKAHRRFKYSPMTVKQIFLRIMLKKKKKKR